MLGPIAAAVAGALASDLPEGQIAHAMALAATQAGGAAQDAVRAVELAAGGREGALSVLDRPGGLFQTLLQGRALDLAAWPSGRR